MYKTCTKCGEIKELGKFYKDNRNGKLRSSCIQCSKDYTKATKESRSLRNKKYYKNNSDRIKEKVREYAKENKEKIRKSSKKYRENNKEFIRLARKDYYQRNKKEINEKNKKYVEYNKSKVYEYQREYRKQNKELLQRYIKEYVTKRLKEDKLFKLKMQLNHRIRQSVIHKYKNTKELTGLDMKELIKHLTKDLPENFEWSDYHIDHICPCAQAKSEDELIRLQHHSNLRLITATENLQKGKKLTEEGKHLCVVLLNREVI